jgi:GntR family transcriptional regulator
MESTADQVGNVTPDQSRNVTYRVIDAREVVAPEPIRVILELPPGAGVTLLERVATIDDQPLSLITCWTVADLGRPLLKLDLTRGFFDLLEQELDVTLGDAHGTIDAVAADDSVAALLNRALGSPLLYSETIVRLISGRPIAVISARSRPDRTITTTLRRRAKRARPPVETVPPSAGSKAAGDNQRALEPVQVGQ